MITRRTFLKRLGIGAGAAVVAPTATLKLLETLEDRGEWVRDASFRGWRHTGTGAVVTDTLLAPTSMYGVGELEPTKVTLRIHDVGIKASISDLLTDIDRDIFAPNVFRELL